MFLVSGVVQIDVLVCTVLQSRQWHKTIKMHANIGKVSHESVQVSDTRNIRFKEVNVFRDHNVEERATKPPGSLFPLIMCSWKYYFGTDAIRCWWLMAILPRMFCVVFSYSVLAIQSHVRLKYGSDLPLEKTGNGSNERNVHLLRKKCVVNPSVAVSVSVLFLVRF